MSSKLSIKF